MCPPAQHWLSAFLHIFQAGLRTHERYFHLLNTFPYKYSGLTFNIDSFTVAGAVSGLSNSLDAPTSRFIAYATPETADRIRISRLYCQFGNRILSLSGLTIWQWSFKMRASLGALISIGVKREVGAKPTLPPQR